MSEKFHNNLPQWAHDAINESCQCQPWHTLISTMQLRLKSSNMITSENDGLSSSSNKQNQKKKKRFYEYNELEQAVLVEQELRQLQLQGNQSLHEYSQIFNAIIDDKLMKLIDTNVNASVGVGVGVSGGNDIKLSNVQQLMTSCARIIVGALESSPPQLQSTAKLFINRLFYSYFLYPSSQYFCMMSRSPILDDLRAFIWSSSLSLNRRSLQMLPTEKISPSLDVILSRRCHLLLDGHFRDLSTRSSSALVKSILVDYYKRNYHSLPSEEIILSSGLTTTQNESDYTLFDRLFFIAIILCSVFPGPIASTNSSSSSQELKSAETSSDNTVHSLPITKPQYMLSIALQALMEDRHLAMYSNQSSTSLPSTTGVRVTPPSNETNSLDIELSRNPHQIASHSPFLSYTRALVNRKNPLLSEHILSLFSSSSIHSDIIQNTTSLYIKSLPHVNATQYTIITYFYDILINESLLRGLSGLLSLSVTQFVWDQCFIFGFKVFLPLVTSSLILGCGSEILSLSYGVTIVETFVSYCQHISVERLQRLLTEYCEAELQDLFDITSTYALDYDELSETKILQAVCKKLNPWELHSPSLFQDDQTHSPPPHSQRLPQHSTSKSSASSSSSPSMNTSAVTSTATANGAATGAANGATTTKETQENEQTSSSPSLLSKNLPPSSPDKSIPRLTTPSQTASSSSSLPPPNEEITPLVENKEIPSSQSSSSLPLPPSESNQNNLSSTDQNDLKKTPSNQSIQSNKSEGDASLPVPLPSTSSSLVVEIAEEKKDETKDPLPPDQNISEKKIQNENKEEGEEKGEHKEEKERKEE